MKALEGKTGSIVVLDVHTGATMVQASSPSFDPNNFTNGISENEWKELSEDERAPLRNKAIAGEYAPGSTFKMIVALAALEAGIINKNTSFFCSGSLTLGDGKFHCWKKHGHGLTNLKKGIAQSCDVYFYELSRRVGIDRIAIMAKRFGLGQNLDLDIPGSRPGLIPNKAWKKAAIGKSWVRGETLLAAIGQGFVLTNPFQLAVMTSIIASNGKMVEPTIIKGNPVSFKTNEKYSKEIKIIKKAMFQVVNENKGTAFKSRLEDIKFAGKTGTSQVRRISLSERESDDFREKEQEWKNRDHALFVGYMPYDDPKYSISVIIEHGGSGASTAAPIAKQIFNYINELEV